MYVIGQNNNLKLIESWKELPNFVIIQGDKHTGKTFLTLELSERFKLRYTLLDNSVKTVRELITYMKPDSNTLYHFKNFDTASLQAKNALLKITEEPIRGNYIVITGGPQIKTLQSRARKIIMEPYSFNDVSAMINDKFPTVNTKLLYDSGINTPAKITYYKDFENIEDILNIAQETSEKITYIDPITCISILARFEDRYENYDYCLLYLDMLLGLLKTNILTKRNCSYYDIIPIIVKYKTMLLNEPTFRRKMLLYSMFYDIVEVNNEAAKRFETRYSR